MMHMEIHMFLNTSIECLCVVREKLDRASSLIDLFKTLTNKIIRVQNLFNQSF